jgi:hypothetical protein
MKQPIAEKRPPCWWYVSLSGESALIGAAFVEASSKRAAVKAAMGLTPIRDVIADVLCLPVESKDLQRHVPVALRNKLLTESQIRQLGGKRPGE